MNVKKVHIYTIGCQMNVYDSEQIENLLRPIGYEKTEDLEAADLIIVNTCAIRAKAEEKAFSFLGRVSRLKEKKSHLIVAIGGCVAQQEGEAVFKRAPCVNLVFGTRAIGKVPIHVMEIAKTGEKIIDINMDILLEEGRYPVIDGYSGGTGISKFVTIMRGCDNFCTYCVVPYVRGREMSRPPGSIMEEITHLVSRGVKEVTLLGQNVNSYGAKEKLPSFPELLCRVNEIAGLERIRFATSHPKDLSDDLITAIASLDKVVKHIHLPVQSGSDLILKKMNRRYTRAIYLDKVDRLRSAVPGVEITTDLIVGFPGETEADFHETLRLMETVLFDGVFAFKYSDRPNAPASAFFPKVSLEEKKERLKAILDLQEDITRNKHEREKGSIKEVLVEGPSKHAEKRLSGAEEAPAPIQWTGRTPGITIVNFIENPDAPPSGADLTGKKVRVRIEKALAHSLWGIHV